MATTKIQTGIRLPSEMLAKIRKLAEQDSRSANNLIEIILKKYLSDYEANHGKILDDD